MTKVFAKQMLLFVVVMQNWRPEGVKKIEIVLPEAYLEKEVEII